jgi:hypothetical protein
MPFTTRVANISTTSYWHSQIKLSVFTEVIIQLDKLSRQRSTSQNTERFQFTRSWILTLDIRAIRATTALTPTHAELCKCMYVYIHFIKLLKYPTKSTKSIDLGLYISWLCKTVRSYTLASFTNCIIRDTEQQGDTMLSLDNSNTMCQGGNTDGREEWGTCKAERTSNRHHRCEFVNDALTKQHT